MKRQDFKAKFASSERKVIYKLIWWTRRDLAKGRVSGEEDFDMTDHPVAHPMDKTGMSECYQALYESPNVCKVEIWQFFAGFDRA